MPTTVTKIIGTGGDYTTIAAWLAACPANLVTADQIWQGKLKNQTFNEAVVFSGITTDATRYIELTTDTGASFRDNASVRSNALRYNASNGAAITSSDASNTGVIRCSANMDIKLSSSTSTGASWRARRRTAPGRSCSTARATRSATAWSSTARLPRRAALRP
jgi:hypothetical protein